MPAARWNHCSFTTCLKKCEPPFISPGFISGGQAEEIYTSMLDAEMAAKISTRGGIGLSEMLLHQLGSRSVSSQEGKIR